MIILSVDNKADESLLKELDKELSGIGSFYNSEGIDQATLIQYIVEVTEITAPLIAGYLLGMRKSDKVKIIHKGKVDAEIAMAVNKHNVKKMELAALMIKKFEDTYISEKESESKDIEADENVN